MADQNIISSVTIFQHIHLLAKMYTAFLTISPRFRAAPAGRDWHRQKCTGTDRHRADRDRHKVARDEFY